MPGLRASHPTPRGAAARRFSLIAWPAFAVLVITGIWNILAIKPSWSGSYGVTLMVKIAVVAVSGVTAFLHAQARSKAALAAFGALTALSALGALFLGIMLAGS